MSLCRACLSTEPGLIPMDLDLVQSFKLLTGIEIIIYDSSLHCCQNCKDKLELFKEFRDRCIAADLRFQEVSLSGQDIKLENEEYSEIKEEIKFDILTHSENFDDIYDESNEHEETKRVKKKRKVKGLDNKIKSESTITENYEKLCSLKKVHCGLCEKKFDDRTELNKHLEYHKTLFDAQISCGLCTERFVNLAHMLGHRAEHLPTEQRRCHLCLKRFHASSAACLEFHYMRHHAMAEKDAPIQCKQCPNTYASSRKLIRHVRNCHSAPRYECDLCRKGFRNTTLLKLHTRMKHTQVEKTVKCDQCDFTSKYANSLVSHVARKHTAHAARCRACCRVFRDGAALAAHARACRHHQRTVCPVCGQQVKHIWLKHHMRSHSDETPFKCPQCPAKYKYRTGLRDHMLKHEGTTDHHCTLCSKSFGLKSALQSHLKTHNAEKPYVCKICNTGFKRRYNLKVHMNAHPWSAADQKQEDDL